MGLGRKLAGAALAGAGAGIVQQAANRRQEALMRQQRKWQKEDRQASQSFTREGWDRQDARSDAGRDASTALTREGWDRADARGDDSLIQVQGDDGTVRYARRGDAEGAQVPTTRSAGRLVKVKHPDTGKPMFVPSDQAVGMEAYEPDKGKTHGKSLTDPITGEFLGYAPSPDEWQQQQAGARAAGAADSQREEALASVGRRPIEELSRMEMEATWEFWDIFDVASTGRRTRSAAPRIKLIQQRRRGTDK